MKQRIPLLLVLLLFSATLYAQSRNSSDSAKVPTIAEKVAPMEKFPGYFPFYWDAKAGKLWLEIDKWNSEFLYVESLPAGIGSNDLGLDRGQLGQSHIVRFERTGPRVLLTASNYGFRANSNDADERRAVRDASLNRLCGDLKSRQKKVDARWSMRPRSICGTRMESRGRCNARSRALSGWNRHAVPSISPTRRTFPGTPKSKQR